MFANTLERLMCGFTSDEGRELLSVALCHVGGVIIGEGMVVHVPFDENRDMTKKALQIFPVPNEYKVS